MDATTYISYRHDNRPNQVLATFAIRTGRPPALVIAHPSERDQISATTPASIPVTTLPHGGPHPGELWIAGDAA